MAQAKKSIGNSLGPRMVVAFVLGLLLGILAGKVGAGLQNVLPYLLFPPVIGIAEAFTVNTKQSRPYLVTLGTGMCTWLGISVYLFFLAARTNATPCAVGTCANTNLLTALLIFYLLAGFVLITVAALLACVLIRYYRQLQSKRS